MARRNILLLIADDLGRDLGFLGNRVVRTPRIDGLAAEGVSFDRAFCTTASCSASRSVMYTGLYNHETGHYGHSHAHHHFLTSTTVRTAPRIFAEAGYRTGILNKVHVGPPEAYPWEVRREDVHSSQQTRHDAFGWSRDGAAIARAATEFLTADSRPFFLTIGFMDPHRDNTRGGFGNADYPDIDRRIYRPDEIAVPRFLPDLPEVRGELAEYYQAIDRLDQGVGMVLDALDRSGHRDDTLVLLVSDNGPPFVNSKTTLYEPGIHLPFLVRVPGGPAGARSPNLVSFIDILPTLMEWAGIPAEPQSRRLGRSLLPILGERGELTDWGRVFASHTFHGVTEYYPTRVLRERRFKYLKNVRWKLDFPFPSDLYGSHTWHGILRAGAPIGARSVDAYLHRPLEELYDLDLDPCETTNLAAVPAHADRLARMRAEVESWQEATRDPWLLRDGVCWLEVKKFVAQGLEIPRGNDMAAAGRRA